MPITHPTYRDIYIDKGTNFSNVIEISIPFIEYNFSGLIKSSYASNNGIPFEFSSVDNEPNKVRISVSSTNTSLLRRFRGVYDIFASNIISGEIHKEREGTAYYSSSASIDPAPLPQPEGYTIPLSNVIGAGSAASANVEEFATAEQGLKADTALQLTDIVLNGEIPGVTHVPIKVGQLAIVLHTDSSVTEWKSTKINPPLWSPITDGIIYNRQSSQWERIFIAEGIIQTEILPDQ